MSYTKMFAREYTVQYADVCLRMASPEIAEHVPLVSKTFSWFPEDNNEVLCQKTEDWHAFLEEVEKRYKDSKDQDRFIADFHTYGNAYVAIAKEIGSLPFSELTNQQLLEHYERYFTSWILYTAYLWVSFVLNDILAEKGQDVLTSKNVSESTRNEIMTVLFSPNKRGGILQLQVELFELKKQNLESIPNATMERILHEYAWMPCLDLQNEPWDREHVQAFYTQLVVNEPAKLSFGEAATQADLTPDEQLLFTHIKELAYIKDMRDVYRRGGVYEVLPLFNAIGERLTLSRKDVASYTHDELVAALEKNSVISPSVITERQKGFLMQWKEDSISISTDVHAIEAFKENFPKNNEQLIKGAAASRGIVQGRAKIVRGVQDLGKIEAGDILVAITTHPDFVPAMQRAVAFVTDEGGLTSHAAIVAREMKKPCIVGTKTATKILQDGDEIQVDANTGVVKILSSKNS